MKPGSALIFLMLLRTQAAPSSGTRTNELQNACVKSLPQSLRKALKEDLCAGPDFPGHEGPAQCASAARKELSGWQPAAIGNLCRGAVGTAAVRCIRSFRRSTPQDLQISLCRPLGQLQVKATSATTTAHASPSPSAPSLLASAFCP